MIALKKVQCRVMGVLNVTPDSFSDGGEFLDTDSAWTKFNDLVSQGADIIDIGAESSRPGAKAIDQEEEWGRLKPLLERASRTSLKVQISIDTRKPELMIRSLDYGIHFVNDIEGARDHKALEKLAKSKDLSYICMHMHGTPETMQKAPLAGLTGLEDIDRFFEHRTTLLRESGFDDRRIFMDPGFGFGKSDDLNTKIIAAVEPWTASGRKIVMGVSRKSYFARTLGLSNPLDRDPPSKMVELATALMGASIVRTHDVKTLKAIITMAST